jgi:parvulin-like peptidyl-prolyl isomerase
VRLLDKNTVYVTESYLQVNTLPKDYLDRKLIEVNTADIRRVEVQTAADKYAIARDEKGVVSLDPIPQGKRVKDSDRDNVMNALRSLEFTDVALSSKMPLEWDTTYTCRLANDVVYTVKLAKTGDKTYAKLSATAPTKLPFDPKENEQNMKKKDALLQAYEKANALTPRHAPWVYELPTWTADEMRRPLNALVEDIPKETAPEEVAASHVLIAYKGAERSTATRTKEEARKIADEVLAKAKAPGADFAALAREFSDEPGAKDSGGDLGTFKKGVMAKAFEEAAFKLKVGEISDVVETPFGFHIIKRTK